MEKEEAIAEEMFLTRVGELPVVTSALGQVKDMYTWTKERNGLLKYTLEAGEGAVCSVSGKALPVVSSKLQGSGREIFTTIALAIPFQLVLLKKSALHACGQGLSQDFKNA